MRNNNKNNNNKKQYKGGKTNTKGRNNYIPNSNAGSKYDKDMYENSDNKSKFGSKSNVDCRKGGNDPSWYARNPIQLKQAASYSYNSAVGGPYRLDRFFGKYLSNTLRLDKSTGSIPGVMALELMPTPGIAENSESPLNLAAQNLYSFVRHANSGSANYDAPDLMFYMLAMDNLFSYYNWIKRLYGIMTSYSQFSRYTPKVLIEANYVDYEDLLLHLNDFGKFINQMGARISSFNVPATMPYFLRHSWMYSNVYADSSSSKAQYYEYVPRAFYAYDETSSPKGGLLIPIPVSANDALLTTTQVEALGINIINRLQYSEDINVMSGDILKAYGDSGLFKISAMDPDYTVRPVYNEEVLTQIHNATVLGMSDITKLTISQDPNTNYIKFNPGLTPGFVPYNNEALMLNLPYNDVTPEDTMVASRLCAAFKTEADGKAYFRVLGSEFVSRAYIYKFEANVNSEGNLDYRNMKVSKIGFSTAARINFTDPVTTKTNLISAVNAAAFDWAPMIMYSLQVSASDPEVILGFAGDYTMYTVISLSDAEYMNLTAMQSLFNIPAGNESF